MNAIRTLKTLLIAGLLTLSVQVSTAAASLSPIEQRYTSEPALADLLGNPTGAEYSVMDGRVRHYQWGSLYWSSATGVHEVHGAIRARYHALGGPTKFGWPKTDESDVVIRDDWGSIGRVNDFQLGSIAWTSDTGAVSMSTPLASEWRENIYPFLYMPLHNEQNLPNGKRLDFGDNDIYWCSWCGSHVLWVEKWGTDIAVAPKWLATGGSSGFLGLPTTDLIYNEDGQQQRFQGGLVLHKGDQFDNIASSFEVHGAILAKWNALGGINGLGYPVSDEYSVPQGRRSDFENGSLVWNSSTNIVSVS